MNNISISVSLQSNNEIIKTITCDNGYDFITFASKLTNMNVVWKISIFGQNSTTLFY